MTDMRAQKMMQVKQEIAERLLDRTTFGAMGHNDLPAMAAMFDVTGMIDPLLAERAPCVSFDETINVADVSFLFASEPILVSPQLIQIEREIHFDE